MSGGRMGLGHEGHGFDELVRQAQNGDRRAMDLLLEAWRSQMVMVARNYADPAHAAESVSDFVQEAELRAWQGLAQFRGGVNDQETQAMWGAWIQQIVRRVGLNHVQARNAQRRKDPDRKVLPLAGGAGSTGGAGLEPSAGGSSPSAHFLKDERAQLVRTALEGIPDETDRAIVRLCFFDGLSFGQIAARVGFCYETVRQRYHEALGRMENELKGRL